MNLFIKNKHITLILVTTLLLICSACSSTTKIDSTHEIAIQLIDEYITANDLNITKHSPEYEIFLRDIIYWNLHPELVEGDHGELVEEYINHYLKKDHPQSVELNEKLPTPVTNTSTKDQP